MVSSLKPARRIQRADWRLLGRFFLKGWLVICSDCQRFMFKLLQSLCSGKPIYSSKISEGIVAETVLRACKCIKHKHKIHSLHGWSCLLYSLDLSHLAFSFWPVNSNEVTVIPEQRCSEMFVLHVCLALRLVLVVQLQCGYCSTTACQLLTPACLHHWSCIAWNPTMSFQTIRSCPIGSK